MNHHVIGVEMITILNKYIMDKKDMVNVVVSIPQPPKAKIIYYPSLLELLTFGLYKAKNNPTYKNED